MSIYIEKVRIQNFRSLHHIEVTLAPSTTLLVGANNSGKTSFLRALAITLNSDRKLSSLDDLFIDKDGQQSNEKIIKIDIKIIPANGKQEFNNQWATIFGDKIRKDTFGRDFFAFRATINLDNHIRNALVKREVIDDWESSKAREDEGIATDLSAIPFYFIDAQRDLHEDVFSRTSHFGKLASKIEYDDEQRKSLENALKELNKNAINQSPVLAHLKNSLEELNRTMQTKGQGVEITPFPKKIRDLHKGLKIHFQDGTSDSFSLEYHGMGTRSWASLLAFKANIGWDAKEKQEENEAFFPILALEEPEAHLHPNAQRQVYKQLTDISSGQKIISTHSPYIVGQAKLEEIRHFRKETDKTEVTQLDWSSLTFKPDSTEKEKQEGISEITRKIHHTIMNTRGELLFARAVVLFEGETEEQALPVFAEKHWRIPSFEKGICFIGIGGNHYKAFLHLLVTFNIKWFIFSDYDKETIKKGVDNALEFVKCNTGSSNVILLNKTFENYLVDEGYKEELKAGINREFRSVENNEQAIVAHDKKVNDYTEDDLKKFLKDNKTKFASFYAEEIVKTEDESRQIPPKIKELFKAIDSELNASIHEGDQSDAISL